MLGHKRSDKRREVAGAAKGGAPPPPKRGKRRTPDDEDLDDDLAFDSEDERDFGWYFNGEGKKPDAPDEEPPEGGRKTGKDAANKNQTDRATMDREFRKLKAAHQGRDDAGWSSEEDDDSDESDEGKESDMVNLSDLLDEPTTSAKAKPTKKTATASHRVAREGPTLAPKPKAAMAKAPESLLPQSSMSAGFTVAPARLTDLIAAVSGSSDPTVTQPSPSGGDGFPSKSDAAASSSSALLPGAVVRRLEKVTGKGADALRVGRAPEPHVKEQQDRAVTRKKVKEDLKEWKPMLEQMKRAKQVQFPLKVARANPMPTTLGGIAHGVEERAAEPVDGSAALPAIDILTLKPKSDAPSGDGDLREAPARLTPGGALAKRLGDSLREKLERCGLRGDRDEAHNKTTGNGGDASTGQADGGPLKGASYVPIDADDDDPEGGPGRGPDFGYVRKLKALLTYEVAKRRRFNKIKSKTYRRILRKEKERTDEKRRTAMELLDPERAQKRLQAKLDKSRAEERVTQKHKNTSQWVKHVKKYGKFDVETRDALNEQSALHAKLMAKMDEPAEAEYEEVAEDDDAHASSEEEDALVDTLLTEGATANPRAAVASLWTHPTGGRRRGMDAGATAFSEDNTADHDAAQVDKAAKARKELLEMNFMKRAKERHEKQMVSEMRDLQDDLKRVQGGEAPVHVPASIAVAAAESARRRDHPVESAEGTQKERARLKSQRKRRRKDEIDALSENDRSDDEDKHEQRRLREEDRKAARERLSANGRLHDRMIRRDAAADDRATAVKAALQDAKQAAALQASRSSGLVGQKLLFGAERKEGPVNVRLPAVQGHLPVGGEFQDARAALDDDAQKLDSKFKDLDDSTPADEEADGTWHKPTPDQVAPAVPPASVKPVEGKSNKKAPRGRRDAAPSSVGGHGDMTTTVVNTTSERAGPDRILAPRGEKRVRASPVAEGGKGAPVMGDVTRQQQDYLVSRAFAQDDVDEDFLREKGLQVDRIMKPKDKGTANLPGWGAWGGTDEHLMETHVARVAASDTARNIERSMLMKARADAHLDHVIINHDVDLVPSQHTLHMVPRPFASATDYQRFMRQPMGPEWNTPSSFIEGVAPRVKTAAGVVIEPLEKGMALRAPAKTSRRNRKERALTSRSAKAQLSDVAASRLVVESP